MERILPPAGFEPQTRYLKLGPLTNQPCGRFFMDVTKADKDPLSRVMTNPIMPYVNNKGANQPVPMHRLISIFVIHCLDSVIPRLLLGSLAEQASLSL